MTLEDLVNFVSRLRRKPSLYKVLKKLGFPINKEEFLHLCATQSVLLNSMPCEIGTRLSDGTNIIDVHYGDESARFWVEVKYKRIIRAHSMSVNLLK
ncbi:hypothetical protein [Bacillus mycoides]|uniref:Uncharacterized protein n=1 Tax=Bacillus mycoides (strain KBAB4) TaxID=315730 RepID=A9VVG6_BACMK|nr:hypothetical protein [Bacillus mycoides]ABY46781.1 hypothetical protein BcerKBAB4_5286 [Bacillus mycoides KBAB4]